mgnify:CR=1 FL=1|jgi:hypothetical protein
MAKEIRLWLNKDELSDKVTIVDDEDYDKVMSAISERAKWYYRCMGQSSFNEYAINGNRRMSVHRVVMDAPKGMDVDHINGNGLDNRKENLRLCTRSQNCMNQRLKSHSRSGYKGVAYEPIHRQKYTSKKTGITTVKEYKLSKPYRAYIGNGKGGHITLGRYATGEEAARVRDLKAVELHGEFVYLNFPDLLEEYKAELEKNTEKNFETSEPSC